VYQYAFEQKPGEERVNPSGLATSSTPYKSKYLALSTSSSMANKSKIK
jgi:hypothetical protein